MTQNLALLFKKYTVPTVFTLLGLVMVVMGFSSDQNSIYMLAAFMMLLAGVLSFLYSTGAVSSKIITYLGLGAAAFALVTLFLSITSVRDTTIHMENFEKCYSKSVLNLSDIRAAQKAHAEKHGKYAATWEELIDFIENGTVPYIVAEGVVPGRKITEAERDYLYGDNRAIDNNMTEEEAYRLSKWESVPGDLMKFKRDTIMVKFMETKFNTQSYIIGRQKAGFGKFYADSLPYIPMSGGKMWNMETKDSVQIGEEYFPAIRVEGKLPLAEIKGTEPIDMYFGKLTTNDTGGSWEQ